MPEPGADRYRVLFDDPSSGVAYCKVLLDEPAPHDFVYLEVNAAFERLSGLKNAVGKRVSELLPGIRERDGALLDRYAEVATTGRAQQFQRRPQAPGLWFSVSAYCPEPGHFVAVYRLIGDQALAATAHEREEQYRTLTTELQVGVLLQGPSSEILLSNPKALELLGLTEAQLLGKDCFDPSWNVIHDDGTPFPGPTHPVPQAIASRRPVRDVVMGVYRPARHDRVWLQVSAIPQLHPDGSVRQVVCTFSDISERKRIEEELRRVMQEQESILASANVGITLTIDRTMVWVNPGMEELFGYTRSELVGQSTRLFHTSDESYAAMALKRQETIDTGLPLRTELELRRKDGTMIWVDFNARLADPADASKGLIVVLSDRTALRRAEDALVHKQAQLEALNSSLTARVAEAVADLRAKDRVLITQSRQAAMGEMIGNVAHQWRQPLNALGIILANLEDAARFDELDVPAVTRAVSQSKLLIQSMSRTINDFRDFFRPDKERLAFPCLEKIRETISLVDASFRSAGIEIVIEPGPELRLLGFPNEYAQVLLNLLSNAKQAIAERKIPAGRVMVTLGIHGGLASLRVRDNGGGVPAELLEKIFEPYFSTKKLGTGIGLYMSRQIMEQSFGGSLVVRNVDGGAEFELLTPFIP